MCRSSRILAFVGLAAFAFPAHAQRAAPRGPALAAPGVDVRPGVSPGVASGVNRGVLPSVRPGVAPGIRPGVVPGVRPGVDPNVRNGLGPRGLLLRDGRGGRRFGYGGYDLGAAGLGLDLAGGFPPAPYAGQGFDGGYGAYPMVVPAAYPPPCPHPLIIAIGRGLRHTVRTHVVYGARPACAP